MQTQDQQDVYEKAKKLFEQQGYYTARELFLSLNGYKDSPEYAEQCREKMDEIRDRAEKIRQSAEALRAEREASGAEKKKKRARVKKGLVCAAILCVIIAAGTVLTVTLPAAVEKEKTAGQVRTLLAENEYTDARTAAEKIADEKERNALIREIARAEAAGLASEGQYDEAVALLADSPDYDDWLLADQYRKNIDYLAADALYENKEYEEARDIFYRLGDFSDSADRYAECVCRLAEPLIAEGKRYETAMLLKPDAVMPAVAEFIAGNGLEDILQADEAFTPGEMVSFGMWHKRETADQTMRWYVLDREGEMAYIAAASTVAEMAYGESSVWADSGLRAWLNGEFLEGAFTALQRESIRVTRNKTSYGGGKEDKTEEKVFVLSLADVDRYFGINGIMKGKAGYVSGWLRDGDDAGNTAYVTDSGRYGVRESGSLIGYSSIVYSTVQNGQIRYYDVPSAENKVRPAMWVNISTLWENRQADYETAGKLQTEEKYGEAAALFLMLGDYSDSAKQASACINKVNVALYARAKELYEQGEIDEALPLFEQMSLYAYRDSARYAGECRESLNAREYAEAAALLEQGAYEEALSRFEALDDYSDSRAQCDACCEGINALAYAEAAALLEQGAYEEALSRFEALDDYGDSLAQCDACREGINALAYAAAAALLEQGAYEEAISRFEALDGYSDSKEQIKEAKYRRAGELLAAGENYTAYTTYLEIAGYSDTDTLTRTDSRLIAAAARYELNSGLRTPGSFVTLGRYPQGGAESEPVEWLVLDHDAGSGRSLLISRYALDCVPYHETEEDVSWKDCSLNKWLNETFLNEAFSGTEQEMLVKAPWGGKTAEDEGPDRVFLLSAAEAGRYLPENALRKAEATGYAKERGAWTAEDGCAWWLRSSGGAADHAACVNADGSISRAGHVVNLTTPAVRPVIYVDLNRME